MSFIVLICVCHDYFIVFYAIIIIMHIGLNSSWEFMLVFFSIVLTLNKTFEFWTLCRCCWNVATYKWTVHNGNIEILSFVIKFCSSLPISRLRSRYEANLAVSVVFFAWWFGLDWLWCLMPLSTIFQLYRSGQFYW
jgi:hypothetical protein